MLCLLYIKILNFILDDLEPSLVLDKTEPLIFSGSQWEHDLSLEWCQAHSTQQMQPIISIMTITLGQLLIGHALYAYI